MTSSQSGSMPGMNRDESIRTNSSIASRASRGGGRRDRRPSQTRTSTHTLYSTTSTDDGGFSINPNNNARNAPTRGISANNFASRRTLQHESLHIFDSGAHALTDAEKREMWRAEGKCFRCGEITTHAVKKFGPWGVFRRNEALTVAGQVYKGRCLNCNDLETVKRELGEEILSSSNSTTSDDNKAEEEQRVARSSRRSLALSSIAEVDRLSTVEENAEEVESRDEESEEEEECATMFEKRKFSAKRRRLICMMITLMLVAGIIAGTVFGVVYFLGQRETSKGKAVSEATPQENTLNSKVGGLNPKDDSNSRSSPATSDSPPVPTSKKNGWVQVGSDLLPPPIVTNGKNHIEQHFGQDVSMSANGKRVAVGTPKTYGKGDMNGLVVVYELSSKGNEWKVMGDAMWGKKSKDQTGASVSLNADGTRLAVGSLGNEEGGGGFVSVYTFKGEKIGWTLLGEPIKSSQKGDQFASSVSLSGDGTTIAIGAPKTGTGNEPGGSVHVYKYDTNKQNWIQMGDVLREENNDEGSGFGKSVSLSFDGKKIAIGAPYANNRAGVGAGFAYVYLYKTVSRGKMNWELSHEQRGRYAGDWAGWSVSINYLGDIFVIGSKNASRKKSGTELKNAGSVGTYFYETQSSDWYLFSRPIDGQDRQGYLGSSVALSGDSFTMAATSEAPKGGNSAGLGYVSVYERYEYDSSQWFPVGEEIVGDRKVDKIGTSHALALSEDGHYIVVGSESKKDDISGRARVYVMQGS